MEEGESFAAADANGAITVTVSTVTETRELAALPTEAVYDAISAAFGSLPWQVEEVLLGDEAVSPGDSFEDWGIAVTLYPPLCCCPAADRPPHPRGSWASVHSDSHLISLPRMAAGSPCPCPVPSPCALRWGRHITGFIAAC